MRSFERQARSTSFHLTFEEQPHRRVVCFCFKAWFTCGRVWDFHGFKCPHFFPHFLNDPTIKHFNDFWSFQVTEAGQMLKLGHFLAPQAYSTAELRLLCAYFLDVVFGYLIEFWVALTQAQAHGFACPCAHLRDFHTISAWAHFHKAHKQPYLLAGGAMSQVKRRVALFNLSEPFASKDYHPSQTAAT